MAVAEASFSLNTREAVQAGSVVDAELELVLVVDSVTVVELAHYRLSRLQQTFAP